VDEPKGQRGHHEVSRGIHPSILVSRSAAKTLPTRKKLEMEFRRSGQRDGRRRRVLMDDGQASNSRDSSSGDQPSRDPVHRGGVPDAARRNYAAGASEDRQPRITDLIPVRPWLCWVILLSALCGAAGVEAAYARAFLWYSGDPANPHLAPLSVDGYGTLATTYCATMLCLIAVNSLMTYRIRRHKIDDYRARYRVWPWTSALLVLAAAETSTGIHRVSIEWIRELLPTNLYGRGDRFWTLAFGVPALMPLTRIFFEIRRSRAAAACLISAGSLLCVACLQRLEFLHSQAYVWSALLRSASTLAAHWLLFCASLLYLRYVFLDAQNRIPRRITTARTRTDEREARTVANQPPQGNDNRAEGSDTASSTATRRRGLLRFASKKLRVDKSHRGTPSESADATPKDDTRKSGPRNQGDEDDVGKEVTTIGTSSGRVTPETRQRETAMPEETGDDDDQSLSKAERRRLRKLKRRQQRQA
jgi:hypothetical protein